MAKYRITVLIDLYDDPEPSYKEISESVHTALDELGEIKEIRHEDEYCIKKNNALDWMQLEQHPAT